MKPQNNTPLALAALHLTPEKVRALTGAAKVSVAAGPGRELGFWLEAQKAKIIGRASAYQVEVTPELAAQWLRFNEKNRKPSQSKIRRFGRMMAAGKWILNGETIKFSAAGRLLDGQSHLHAIVSAGVPVPLEVRAGLTDASQESMDTGEARKHSHQLEILGERNPNEVAAALRLVHFWEHGLIGSAGNSGRGNRDITNTTIRECLERHPGVRASVGRCLNLKALLPVSAAAFFHYIFSRIDQKKADSFVDKLTTGANLGATSPVHHLRERLIQDRMSQTRLRKRDKFALIVKAWNAYRLGKTVTRLTFASDDTFPAISGAEKSRGVK